MQTMKRTMPIRRDYTLYDSNFRTFWKRQDYGVSKMTSSCQCWVRRDKQVGTEDFQGNENTLYDTTEMAIFYGFVQRH